jgi:hypothetical protein
LRAFFVCVTYFVTHFCPHPRPLALARAACPARRRLCGGPFAAQAQGWIFLKIPAFLYKLKHIW